MDPDKIFDDLKQIVSGMRYREYLPTFGEFYRLGYTSLHWALREFGYHEVAEKTGIPADPNYYNYKENLDDEIIRIFLRPHWGVESEDEDAPKVRLPNYRDIRSHPDLYDGVLRVGGMSQIFPPKAQFYPVDAKYYFDEENLKTELEIIMKRKRTKLLPTYSQAKEHNTLLPEIYLLRGGYYKSASQLGFEPNKVHLRDPVKLRYELSLTGIAQARKDGTDILEDGLPDYYMSFIPSEEEIRDARRTDLHKAIMAMGGYYIAAEQMHLSLHATFWRGNISLKEEMKKIARRLERPHLLPTADELLEIDRHDLAMAIRHNGGIRKTAEMCGLRLPKTARKSEAPLRHVTEDKGFKPYPSRRFNPKLKEQIDGWIIHFEIASDAKTDRGRVEEYGVWFSESSRPSFLLGRYGWVRRRPGESNLWMHRLEGESNWNGTFKDHDLEEAIRQIIKETGITTETKPEEERSGRGTRGRAVRSR